MWSRITSMLYLKRFSFLSIHLFKFQFILFLCVSCISTVSSSFEIQNGVVGKPEVFCGIDTIRVKINTEHPFNGRIYVDGESDKQHCVQHSADSHSSPQEFSIPIGACNMRRQRTLHPRGISFSFTMITSFHPFFVTGMDRAFSIRCFFLESIKGLNAEIDVGTLAPQNVDQEYSLPVCAYHLKDGIEGHVLRFAQVGQKVTHVWRCDQDASHVYGILIHSCFADDGHGNKFELVDDRGCSTDPFLLPQIEYESGAISAYTNAQVFKYADKVQLYFTCTVQLCYKHDGGCEGITPPSCSGHSIHPPRISGSSPEHNFVNLGPDNHGPDVHHGGNSLNSESQFHESESTPRVPGYIKPDAFQPIILGPPHPTVFHKDGPSGPSLHHISSFKGPKDIQRLNEEEDTPNPYRRDSPLNDTTEDDIVMQVVTLRSTVPTVSHTPDLVTFKPVVTANEDEDEEEELITPRVFGRGSTSPTTTKVRRTAGEMETDVSVDVIVLPVEDKERKGFIFFNTNSPPQSLSFKSASEVCLSKTASVIFGTAVLLALFCCVTVTFLVTRKRNHQLLHHASKRRIDNF
ncbi:Protein CBG12399 [Caenorhabditis briggsae]|uniref:Protein CBG12399 n=1 Tax=Caenorhabditis briggsae TaxID=6238 RepID=A8XFC3_CAEBR|nr:Protein CBG12399 [Caenorhabditis briggsae]CAP31384.2 Protein CBG12399 [Caenorhabditis briggsae]